MPRCKGTTKTGKRCKNNARINCVCCYVHRAFESDLSPAAGSSTSEIKDSDWLFKKILKPFALDFAKYLDESKEWITEQRKMNCEEYVIHIQEEFDNKIKNDVVEVVKNTAVLGEAREFATQMRAIVKRGLSKHHGKINKTLKLENARTVDDLYEGMKIHFW